MSWRSISAARRRRAAVASLGIQLPHDNTIDFDRYDRIRPIRWTGEALELLDQRKLPFHTEYVRCETSDEVAAAIHSLTVRGAPAIGIAAAWGVVLAGMKIDAADGAEAVRKLEAPMQRLNDARPTAVNLAWALARMGRALGAAGPDWRDVMRVKRRRSTMRTWPPTAAWVRSARP
jgi:methylthioribose-1-phosphate isomerase